MRECKSTIRDIMIVRDQINAIIKKNSNKMPNYKESSRHLPISHCHLNMDWYTKIGRKFNLWAIPDFYISEKFAKRAGYTVNNHSLAVIRAVDDNIPAVYDIRTLEFSEIKENCNLDKLMSYTKLMKERIEESFIRNYNEFYRALGVPVGLSIENGYRFTLNEVEAVRAEIRILIRDNKDKLPDYDALLSRGRDYEGKRYPKSIGYVCHSPIPKFLIYKNHAKKAGFSLEGAEPVLMMRDIDGDYTHNYKYDIRFLELKPIPNNCNPDKAMRYVKTMLEYVKDSFESDYSKFYNSLNKNTDYWD